jgi:hypothetical protein
MVSYPQFGSKSACVIIRHSEGLKIDEQTARAINLQEIIKHLLHELSDYYPQRIVLKKDLSLAFAYAIEKYRGIPRIWRHTFKDNITLKFKFCRVKTAIEIEKEELDLSLLLKKYGLRGFGLNTEIIRKHGSFGIVENLTMRPYSKKRERDERKARKNRNKLRKVVHVRK